MKMLPRSLTGRLMAATMLAVIAATIAAVLVMSAFIWPSSPDAVLRAELAEEVEHIEEGLRIDPGGNVEVFLKPETANTYDAMPKDAAYLVIDAGKRTVAHSPDGPALQALMAMPPSARIMPVKSGSADIRLQVTQETIAHEGNRYTVRVARSDRLVTTLNDYAGELYLRAGTITVLLALATFALVVYLTVNRMVRPLRQASQVAASVGPRNLGTRLRSEGLPTEVVPMIEAFNAALARLENGFRVQQEFLASAAHELKTPLALLQAGIELDGAANKALLLRDTALMARQVHQLLHLAEVSEGHNYSFAPISIAAIVDDAVDYLRRLAGQRGVTLAVDLQDRPAAMVDGDAAAVFVLVKNLLENAIHHSPPGCVVRVAIGADGFSVQDQGAGIAESNHAELFKRFWRGDPKDSQGAGLGLSICMEICLAHGWNIRLDRSRNRAGARFVVCTGENGGPA